MTFQYHHPNFKYCTLYVSGTENRQKTERQTDGKSGYYMPPVDLSSLRHNKLFLTYQANFFQYMTENFFWLQYTYTSNCRVGLLENFLN